MATRKIPDEAPEGGATAPTAEEGAGDDDCSFSSPVEEKPKTGQELYRALVDNGFIGGWKDRTDIGDSVEYARMLRDTSMRVQERLHGHQKPSAK